MLARKIVDHHPMSDALRQKLHLGNTHIRVCVCVCSSNRRTYWMNFERRLNGQTNKQNWICQIKITKVDEEKYCLIYFGVTNRVSLGVCLWPNKTVARNGFFYGTSACFLLLLLQRNTIRCFRRQQKKIWRLLEAPSMALGSFVSCRSCCSCSRFFFAWLFLPIVLFGCLKKMFLWSLWKKL